METDLSENDTSLQKRKDFSHFVIGIEEQLYLQGTPLSQAEILSFLFEKIIENNKKQIAKSSIRGRDLISILGQPELIANQIIERKYPMINLDEDSLDFHSRVLRKLKIRFSDSKSKFIHKIILFFHYSLILFFLFTGLQAIYSTLFILTSSNSYQRTLKMFGGDDIYYFDLLFTPELLIISSMSLFFIELVYISFLKLPSSQKVFTEIPKTMQKLRKQIKLIFVTSQFYLIYLIFGSIFKNNVTKQTVNGFDPLADLFFPIIIFEILMLFVFIFIRFNSKQLEVYVKAKMNINVAVRIFQELSTRIIQLLSITFIILIALRLISDYNLIFNTVDRNNFDINFQTSLINTSAFLMTNYIVLLFTISSFYLTDDQNQKWMRSITRQVLIQMIFALIYLLIITYFTLQYNQFILTKASIPIGGDEDSFLISQLDIVFNFMKYFVPTSISLLIIRSNK